MAAGEYPDSTFYGANSNNYTAANRPSSDPIDKIVVHVTQGSWSSAINWFNDGRAGVSAHYTVRSSDGFVGQSVREKDIAYHAGNWEYNKASIGIEHEGYVSDPKWFTDAMYRSSAKLAAYLCEKYRIPADRTRIIGHHEVPYPNTHTDPGSHWDWDKYVYYVASYAGKTPPAQAAYSQVVDNATADRFDAASAWGTSAYSPQRYGSDYRFTKPGRRTKNAKFKVKVPEKGSYAVYGWWPADPGYNNRTTFRIYTTSGWVARTVSQRTSGGQWVRLGAYTMAAGDGSYVQVSNRSSGAGYIIADAVKLESA